MKQEFYSIETPPLILMQLNINRSVTIRPFAPSMKHHDGKIYAMNQSRELNGNQA